MLRLQIYSINPFIIKLITGLNYPGPGKGGTRESNKGKTGRSLVNQMQAAGTES